MMSRSNNNGGFTIIELMIAICILAILLLVSSVVMTSIGSIYSKGIDMTNVQNDSRNIVQDLTSTIQFSGQPLKHHSHLYPGLGPVYSICFGSTRYSYFLGFPPSGIQNVQIIWKDTMSGTSSCFPLNVSQNPPACPTSGITRCLHSIAGTGSELVGSNMHLANLSITAYNQQLYSIKIGLAYGLEDMFETNSSGNPKISNGNYVCGDQPGQKYCATSSLSTLADDRVQ